MNRRQQQEFRELVMQAFADARKRGKKNWRTMDLSVLKNRLLQRTHRRFREADYGAATLAELVGMFPGELTLAKGRRPTVSLVEDTADGVAVGREREPVGGGVADTTVREDEEDGFQTLLDRYRTSGDNLGVGEAYASQLDRIDDAGIERTFVNMVSRWASSSPVDVELNSVGDLLGNVDKFVDDQLALALVHATLRMEDARRALPARVGDVYYRVADPLRALFGMPPKSSRPALMNVATAKTREMRSALGTAVERFCQSTSRCGQAAVHRGHQAGPRVRGRTRLWESVRHSARWKCCSGRCFGSSVRAARSTRPRAFPGVRRISGTQLQRVLDSLGTDLDHRLRRVVLEPVARHMSHLIEEGTRASDEMLTPAVVIAGGAFKLDLARSAEGVVFPARVVEQRGRGRLTRWRLRAAAPAGSVTLAVSEPGEQFELAPGAERVIRLQLDSAPGDEILELDTVLTCETVNGRQIEFEQTLEFEQQATQPDWDGLVEGSALRDQPDTRQEKPLRVVMPFWPTLNSMSRTRRRRSSGGKNGSARHPCCKCWRGISVSARTSRASY